ncbi:hypothetical protein L3D22_09810 [Lysobacter soli]|nr:hypothetical protein L3D22_09810 [Lysobacter soli]
MYARHADGRITVQAGGDHLPFAARSIRYRHPNFLLTLPRGEPVDVFVRVQSESSMQVPLSLFTLPAFAEAARDAQFVIGAYYGILLALFFYTTWRCGSACAMPATSGTWCTCPRSDWCCSRSTAWASNTCGLARPG